MWRGSGRRAPAKLTRKNASSPRLKASLVAERRRRIRFLTVAGVVSSVVLLASGISVASHLNALQVASISIEGNKKIKTRALEAYMHTATASTGFGVISKQNIFLYPTAMLERTAAYEFPHIESVSITRNLPKRNIEVSLAEREPYAIWCRTLTREDCYLIDATGFIYEKAQVPQEEYIAFSGGVTETRANPLRVSVAPEYFETVRQLIHALKENDISVVEVSFDGADGRLVTAGGWYVLIALDKDLGATAFNMEAVLDEYNLRTSLDSLLYIDMRFDERVYYKFKEENEVTDTEE